MTSGKRNMKRKWNLGEEQDARGKAYYRLFLFAESIERRTNKNEWHEADESKRNHNTLTGTDGMATRWQPWRCRWWRPRKNHQAHHVLSYIFQLLLKHLSEHIPSIHGMEHTYTYACKNISIVISGWMAVTELSITNSFTCSTCMQSDFSPSLLQIHVWMAAAVEIQQQRIVYIRGWFERLIDQIKHIDLFASIVLASLCCCCCCCTHMSVANFARDYTKEKWFSYKMSSVRQKKNCKNRHSSQRPIVFLILILILYVCCLWFYFGIELS